MLNIINSQNTDVLLDISPVAAIEAEVDVTSDSIFWFTPYLASDFPEITCDKKYFFLWSTDHDAGAGGIWWGKGDKLDLSDFVEISASPIFSGFQAETPFLYRFPLASRPIYLYYHTDAADSSNTCNGGGQETRLRSTAGGELHTATWTDEGHPLGCSVGQNHSGYLRFWNINGTLRGNHSLIGGIPSTWGKSTTTDGLSWTQESSYLSYDVFLETNREWALSWGYVFEYYGQLYGFFNDLDDTVGFSLGSTPQGRAHLCRINENIEITELIKTFDVPNKTQPYSFFVEGDTAHFYRQTGRVDYPATFDANLYYATLDLTPLQTL